MLLSTRQFLKFLEVVQMFVMVQIFTSGKRKGHDSYYVPSYSSLVVSYTMTGIRQTCILNIIF